MKRGILYLLLLLLTAGCSEHTGDVEPVDTNGKVQLILTPESVGMTTRAGADEPAEPIDNLNILVFEELKGDDKLTYTYRATAEMTGDGNKYKVTLRLSDVPVLLLLIANYADADFDILEYGYTIEEAGEALLASFTSTGVSSIPMYGEINFPEGLTPQELTTEDQDVEIEKNTPLLRSVAIVHLSMEGISNKFTLKSVQAYRANNQIRIIPNNPATEVRDGKQILTVTAPSVPKDASNTITTQVITTDDDSANALDPFFLSESEKKEGEAVTTEATCLIVGGIYRGDGYTTNTEVTYYRIDFKSENNSITGQILRNNKYNIVITDVKGPGTSHPEDADEMNMETQILDWEQSDHDIKFD